MPEQERAAALEALSAAGYLDDARFAKERARLLAVRGLANDAIRFDLERRGVERQLIEDAVALLTPEAERARAVAATAGGGVRAARALARKGFPAEVIEPIAHEARAELR